MRSGRDPVSVRNRLRLSSKASDRVLVVGGDENEMKSAAETARDIQIPDQHRHPDVEKIDAPVSVLPIWAERLLAIYGLADHVELGPRIRPAALSAAREQRLVFGDQ